MTADNIQSQFIEEMFHFCEEAYMDMNFVFVQEGGLNGFMHSFLAEVMAICRAHVAALGGNALVAYQLTECIIEDNLHKNQVGTSCRHRFLVI